MTRSAAGDHAREAPAILFKLLGLKDDRTVRADFLRNERFRFTQPRFLDDPTEANPVLIFGRYTDRDRAAARLRLARNGIAGLSDDRVESMCLDPCPPLRFDPLLAPGLFPHLKTDQERMDAIRQHDDARAREALARFRDVVNRELGVFCLTESVCSSPMWESYGGRHRGMAVGLDTSHADLARQAQPIDYSGRLEISIHNGVIHLEGVRLQSSELPPIENPMLVRKTPEYAHEREWRVIRRLSARENDLGSGDPPEICLFRIPAAAVTQIVFGLRTTKRDRDRVWAIVRSQRRWSHVELREVVANEGDPEATLSAREYRP